MYLTNAKLWHIIAIIITDRGAESKSNLWRGIAEAGERANAEVGKPPCFSAGLPVKADRLSL